MLKRRIWIINIDDFVDKDSALDAMRNHGAKYLHLINHGDLCVVSPLMKIDKLFVDYVAGIKNILNTKWIITPESHCNGESLVSAIKKDKQLSKMLQEKCGEGYILTPLIYSNDFHKLNQKFKNKYINNADLTIKANDKIEFKKVCNRLKISSPKIIFQHAENKAKITIKYGASQEFLLKHRCSAGGYGNVCGNMKKLMPLFIRQKEVFIEEYLDVALTLGTLAILDKKINFIGIDKQVIDSNSWSGSIFPCGEIDKTILTEIKNKTMKLCRYYYSKGVRGQLNFDWAVAKARHKIFALECNARQNGFGLPFHIAVNTLKIPAEHVKFHMKSICNVDDGIDTKEVIEILRDSVEEPVSKAKIILMTPVRSNIVGLCYIADSENNMKKLLQKKLKHIRRG